MTAKAIAKTTIAAGVGVALGAEYASVEGLEVVRVYVFVLTNTLGGICRFKKKALKRS